VNTLLRTRTRLARVDLLIVLALCVLLVVAAVEGDIGRAALIAGSLLLYFGGWLGTVCATIFCAAVGAYAVAALLAAALLARRLGRSAIGRIRFDPTALAAVVTAMPESAFGPLRAFVGEAPITTRELVRAAHAEGVRRPPALAGEDPGADAYDGPLLPDGRGGGCSQFAAEAVGLATVMAEQLQRPLDAELLGAAAAMVPLSSGAEWSGTMGIGAEGIGAGLSVEQAVAGLSGFTDGPAGGDLMHRVELLERIGPMQQLVHPREQLARVGRAGLLGLRMKFAGAYAVALIEVISEGFFDFLRWAARLPGRLLRAPAGLVARRREGRVEKRERIRPPWARRALTPWSEWPRGVRLLWLGARPALVLAAIAAAFAVDGIGVALLALLAASVRPLRRRWLAWIAVAAVALVSPAAAVLLGVRALLAEFVLWRLGRGIEGSGGASRRGLARVLATRLAAVAQLNQLEPVDLEAAKESLERAAREDADEEIRLERTVSLIAAAWAEARPLELGRALWSGARGAITGSWAAAGSPDDGFVVLRRLYLHETALGAAARGGTILLAAVAAASLVPAGADVLGLGVVASRLVGAAAAALIAVPLSAQPRRSYFGAGFAAVIGVVLLGAAAPLPLACGLVGGLLAGAARAQVAGLVLRGRRRWHGWQIPARTPWRLRRHWRVAEAALGAGREAVGMELLRTLAERGGPAELRALALGRVALLEVERGQLETAAATLDVITAEDGAGSQAVGVATGMLSAALGDLRDAERRLRAALDRLDDGSPLARRASLALADALARRGESAEAIELLRGLRGQPLALQGVDSWIESEVAIAAALDSAGAAGAARERLGEMAELSMYDDVIQGTEVKPGKRFLERLGRAEARLLVLQGRLALEAGRGQEAEKSLERALALLPAARGGSLWANAQVLHGAAMVSGKERVEAVASIRAGVEELERRRSQLRVADRRTAMIVTDEKTYSLALRSLAHAGRFRIEGAALVGATLIESLRRNAIASAMRFGTLRTDPRAIALAEQLDLVERDHGEVGALLAGLDDAVSSSYAASYRPTPVTPERLREAARRYGNVLSFFFPPGERRGWRAWIAPDGTAEISEVHLAGAAAEVLLAGEEGDRARELLIHSPLAEHATAWTALADALLPQGLRQRLVAAPAGWPERILVVPDGPVSLIPWAALRVAEGPLVARAIVQIVPSLELTPERGALRPRPTDQVVAYADRIAGELEPLAGACEVEPATTRERFVGALRSGRFGGAYLAMHGRESGLRQHVEFADGSTLSAATALAYPWPPWVVFATCLVGRVEQVAGQEPLGLAVSCMLGGAETVLASVLEITDDAAAAVCASLAARLAAARNPAEALREAQLAYLEQHALASAASCLGLVCISAATPTALAIRGGAPA